ncbi:hypothetical protein NOS3756_55950 (plasmid) [Nostoc sp. NIES-3756]|uniref:hypothetical protein n=1 Tax=Nostoc sp. NIES-3756 TaxID=1751286 RepID=UPI00071F9072|nr:hypothetical protein [Nostoc sp. NIES-3756]BAT56583.1 hypothetical protein NOS3756_55950 [Nostoc sp. NIES-3756]
MTQQHQQQTLNKALTIDGISQQQARSELVEISGLLAKFQQSYPTTYQYLCTQGQDATLGDAIQAVAESINLFN